MSEFSEIKFGEISGEAERELNPELIEKGFVDLGSIQEEALDGNKFLFLGYKGSGKSFIGERIDLTQGGNHDRFVKKISLADFPYTPFSKIIKGDIEPEAKHPTAWLLILLIYVIESFHKDAGANHPDAEEFQKVIELFKALGVSPEATPSSIAQISAKKSFSLKLPHNLLEYKIEGAGYRSADDIFSFVNVLNNFVSGLRSSNRHFLIIDGLDDILSSRGVQYPSLYALINQTRELNSNFVKCGVPFKIIVFCRTELFDRIAGPNKNKIRNAYGIDLDWYHDPNEPDNSMLVRGANLRANLSIGRESDIFKEFLPSHVYGRPTRQYLLDMTRHTPRDFFQILFFIQKFCGAGEIKESQLKSGIREYSLK